MRMIFPLSFGSIVKVDLTRALLKPPSPSLIKMPFVEAFGTFDVVEIVIVKDTVKSFMGIEVGIWVEISFPTTAHVSPLEPFEDPAPPTPLSPPCETYVARGALVGKRNTKLSIGTSSVFMFDSIFETICESDS